MDNKKCDKKKTLELRKQNMENVMWTQEQMSGEESSKRNYRKNWT